MKKTVKVLNRILTFFLIVVLIFAGYVFLQVLRAGKGRVPSIFGYSFMQVSTGSMEPTIETGSLIIVHKTEADAVKVGDVISFYSSDPVIAGKPNTHRVMEVRRQDGQPVFLTRGDASEMNDPYPVYASQLIGVYQRSLSIGGFVDLLHNQYFFFFALLVPLGVVIFFEILHVKTSAEEKQIKALKKEQSDDGEAS